MPLTQQRKAEFRRARAQVGEPKPEGVTLWPTEATAAMSQSARAREADDVEMVQKVCQHGGEFIPTARDARSLWKSRKPTGVTPFAPLQEPDEGNAERMDDAQDVQLVGVGNARDGQVIPPARDATCGTLAIQTWARIDCSTG